MKEIYKETLVPLDLSDAIAIIDRQKQQIMEKEGEYKKLLLHYNTVTKELTEQIAALTAERDRLKAKREIWEERNVSLEGKCAALAAERDSTDKAYQTLKNQVFDQQTTNEILTAENKRQSEEIRLLRRALGNCNPDHNLLMPEEALRGEEVGMKRPSSLGGEEKPTPIGDIYNDKIAREIWIGYDSENEEEALRGGEE